MKRMLLGISVLLFATALSLNAEAGKIRYVVPGGKPPMDYNVAIKAINDKLKADTGLELTVTYIPWDAWESKINLMIASGEEFDLFQCMQDWIPFSSYYAKGGLQDISAAIDKYGPNLKKMIPDTIWPGAKVQGKTYAVPAFWVELGNEGSFTIRKDLLDANKLPVPKTSEELLNALMTVKNNWKGNEKPYLPFRGGDVEPLGLHSTVLHRGYDSFPFTVKERFFWVNQKGEVKSWVETEEFRKDAAWFNNAYKKGLISPDVLVTKQEQYGAMIDSGNWLVSFGTISTPVPTLQKTWPTLQDEDIVTTMLYPDKVQVRPFGIKNCNAVPVTSKNPENAVIFLNWLYANQTNYDLYMYGIEGTHYKKVGPRTKESVLNATGQLTYSQSDWTIGNLNYTRTEAVAPSSMSKALYTLNTKAENSTAANFFFDASSVRTELANVKTVYAAEICPIYLGVVDYASGFPKALEKMKKAGLDKLVAEYKKQFATYLAGSR